LTAAAIVATFEPSYASNTYSYERYRSPQNIIETGNARWLWRLLAVEALMRASR
jgi:hypothetical protein